MFDLLLSSIDISHDSGKYVSSGKNLFGRPYSSSMYSLSSIFECLDKIKLRSQILEAMILKNFDMNNVDSRTGETIIFDLISNNDVDSLNLVLRKYVLDKNQKLMLNYHNNRGISPLYFAIREFINKKKTNVVDEDDEIKTDPQSNSKHHKKLGFSTHSNTF